MSVTLPDGFLLQVGRSTEARDDILEYFQGVFAIVLVAVLGIGVRGGAWLANRSLRPVRDLAGVLRSIRQTGNMNARAPTRKTGDELDELAGLFNALLDTIESLVNRMRSALDTIAHDLRTPMTRLRGAAEIALHAPPDAETYKQALADCLEETEQTLTMLNTLMGGRGRNRSPETGLGGGGSLRPADERGRALRTRGGGEGNRHPDRVARAAWSAGRCQTDPPGGRQRAGQRHQVHPSRGTHRD